MKRLLVALAAAVSLGHAQADEALLEAMAQPSGSTRFVRAATSKEEMRKFAQTGGDLPQVQRALRHGATRSATQ